MLVTNSLRFSSFENVLVSSSFLKDIYSGYKILCFFLSALEKCCTLPFASMAFDEKSTVMQILFPLVMVFFSHCFQDFFFVFSFKMYDCAISWCVLFGFILFSVYTASWVCRFMSCQLWGVFNVISLSTFSAHSFYPLFKTDDLNVRSFVMVPQVPKNVNFSLVCFCCLDWVLSIALSSSSFSLSFHFALESIPFYFGICQL